MCTKQIVTWSIHDRILCVWVCFKHNRQEYLGTEPCPSGQSRHSAPLVHTAHWGICTKRTVTLQVHTQISCTWVRFKYSRQDYLETEPSLLASHQQSLPLVHGAWCEDLYKTDCITVHSEPNIMCFSLFSIYQTGLPGHRPMSMGTTLATISVHTLGTIWWFSKISQ